MKICTKCHAEKDLSEFGKDAQKKDGLRPDCKLCINEVTRAYQEANREKVRAANRARNAKNSDKINAKTKAWVEANLERHRAYQKDYRKKNSKKITARSKQWRKDNPGKATAIAAKRRASQLLSLIHI